MLNIRGIKRLWTLVISILPLFVARDQSINGITQLLDCPRISRHRVTLPVIEHLCGVLIAHIVQGYRAEYVGITAANDMQARDIDDILHLVCQKNLDSVSVYRQRWPPSKEDGALKLVSVLNTHSSGLLAENKTENTDLDPSFSTVRLGPPALLQYQRSSGGSALRIAKDSLM